MKTPLLIGLAVLVAHAAAAASSRLIVPDAPALMIKTRRTTDRPGAAVTTEILYLKGARQRRETIVETSSHAGAGPHDISSLIQIVQCDERRRLSMYPELRTYVYEPIEDPSVTLARLRDVASRQAPSREMTIGPAVTITIDAVDTGERRQLTHYVARRVITTRTIEPAPGAATPASVSRQDGWYIDVPLPDCTDGDGTVTSFVHAASGGEARDRVTFKQRGTARQGYPIEETQRFGDGHHAWVTKLQLVELSEAPLDDALFTVADGYRPALPRPYGGYDPTRPDTFLNRVDSYREVVVAWTDYVRRNGLRGILWGPRPPARY